MRKLTKFWNIFHVTYYKSTTKEIAHGSVIERFYLIKSLFCYHNFILLFKYSLLERHPQKSDKIEMATKRVRWKFYVFKTCLYFIFNIKLCWQRRFLPFNFFSFLFYCLQRDWKNIFQSLVILRKSWLWRIQQHGVQGMKSYFLFLKKLSC